MSKSVGRRPASKAGNKRKIMAYLGSEYHKNNLAAARQIAITSEVECPICKKMFKKTGLRNHMKSCAEGKNCPVCGKWFKSKGTTCSHSCANTFFRSGINHPNTREDSYRVICFHHHGKKCAVCGEDVIVEVHHMDEDHNNNDPNNLIPLCPTHHRYWHSHHRHLIEDVVKSCIDNR